MEIAAVGKRHGGLLDGIGFLHRHPGAFNHNEPLSLFRVGEDGGKTLVTIDMVGGKAASLPRLDHNHDFHTESLGSHGARDYSRRVNELLMVIPSADVEFA